MTTTSRVLATLVLSAGLLAAAQPVGAAGPSWTVSRAQTVGNQNLILNSVHVPAAGDVWAVGYRYGYVGGATEFRTIIEHSVDGGDFQIVPSPDREGAPATNFLQDISGSAPDDLWTVGWSRNPGQPSRTLVEHWNGSAWAFSTSADPGQYGNILNGITSLASNDVWAVGARQDDFYQTPLTEHWNGSTWTAVRAPNPAYCSGHSYLSDVTARSSGDVWATGICQSSSRGGDQGFVLRWNGTRWIVARGHNDIPTGASLFGISSSGQALWIVGYQRNGTAFAMRSQGSGWTQISVTQSNATFAAVVARSATVAWAVGTAPSPQPPFAGPGASRLGSAEATPTTIPVDFGSLRGVAYDPAGRIWAVGTQLPGQYNTPLIVSRPV